MHCMMMSHGGVLFARYHGLNQSHHEYVLSANSRLKGYEEKVDSLTGLELQVSTLKKQVFGLNDKLSSSDASFAKSKAKGKERKKKIKSFTKSLDNLHTEVARLSAALNQATVLEAKKDEEILWLRATSPDAAFMRGVSMHRTKDVFAAVLKSMAKFCHVIGYACEASPCCSKLDYASRQISKHATEPLSVILQLKPENLAHLTPSVVASEHNEDMVDANVDVSDPKMTDATDVWGWWRLGQGRASSGPNDVVVALFAGEKGDGLVPFSVAGEEAAVNPSRV
ncbi:hypothetical protein Tco_0179227 [Tanacetum coccineum]